MSDQQVASLRKQIDEKVIDARNEVIMQATNVFLFGRQVALVSLGLTVLGIEQAQALFQQAVARGERMESEAQHQFDALQRQLAEETTAQVSTRLAALLNKAPGVSVVYTAKPAAPASQEDNLDDGATEQHDG